MTPGRFLIDLSERCRCWHVDFEELTDPEKVFLCIWELEAEVNNGGFDQYFFNSSGDQANSAPWALRQIGAHSVATLCEEANAVFGESVPSEEGVRRQVMSNLGDEASRTRNALDDRFYACGEDLEGLLYTFVQANLASFEAHS